MQLFVRYGKGVHTCKCIPSMTCEKLVTNESLTTHIFNTIKQAVSEIQKWVCRDTPPMNTAYTATIGSNIAYLLPPKCFQNWPSCYQAAAKETLLHHSGGTQVTTHATTGRHEYDPAKSHVWYEGWATEHRRQLVITYR